MRFVGKKHKSLAPPEILAHAERICKLSGSSFVKCFALMTPTQREAMTLFYAFCREVDDWADEEGLGTPESRQSVLLAMRDDVRGGVGTASKSHWESIVGISCLMERYRISPKPFVDLIDGMLMDCQYQPFRLWNDLLQYCYRVASTVGLISVHFFSNRPQKLVNYAIQQGIALQLVNIYRDFSEDLSRHRSYLPLEWLGVDLATLRGFLNLGERDRLQHPLYTNMIQSRERLRLEAQSTFKAAFESCPLTARLRVWPLLLMGLSYMDFLQQIPERSLTNPKLEPLGALKRSLPKMLAARP